MNVLFVGTPGVRKAVALQRLHEAVLHRYPGERIFTTPNNRGKPGIPLLEERLYGDNPVAFLELTERVQRQNWNDRFTAVRTLFERAPTEHHFLGLHLTFRYHQLPLWPVSFRALIDWRPDIIITFIDDAYLVRQRVHDGLYTSFTLRELTTWRAEELLAADLLARLVDADEPPPNYVVAVQHSASMLARLLFEPQVAPVYLSHPISEIRNDESAREAIDTFRRTLRGYDKLAVFEPLTIDERPPLLAGSLVTSYDPRNPVHRWPILDATDALSADEDLRARYPLALPKAELLEATDALNEQIPSRDLRLCDQAGALIIYRPTMGGVRGLSGGVRAERDQIRGDGRRPRRIIWYVKKGEDQLPDELFKRPPKPGEDPDFVYEETEERLWEIVRALHESYRPEWQHFLG